MKIDLTQLRRSMEEDSITTVMSADGERLEVVAVNGTEIDPPAYIRLGGNALPDLEDLDEPSRVQLWPDADAGTAAFRLLTVHVSETCMTEQITGREIVIRADASVELAGQSQADSTRSSRARTSDSAFSIYNERSGDRF